MVVLDIFRGILVGGIFLLCVLADRQGYSGTAQDAAPVRDKTAEKVRTSEFRSAHRRQPFDAGAHYDVELFVSPEGSDAAGAGNRERPFRTIGHALQVAEPGTKIKVLSGVYPGTETVKGVLGTPLRPIKLKGVGDVIIDGQGDSVGLHLSGPQHVVIEGIGFQNTWPHGLNIDDGGNQGSPAHHVVLRDLRFRDVGSGGNNDCLKLSGVMNFWVVGSQFERCNKGEGIDMVGCHIGVVQRNLFRDIPGNALQTKGGSRSILIQANRFNNIGGRGINAGGHTGRAYFRPLTSPYEAAQIRMTANLFEKIGDSPIAFSGCNDCVFANNTIVQPEKFAARIAEETLDRGPGRNGYFINNIVVVGTTLFRRGSLVDVGARTDAESFVFERNLWVHPRRGFQPQLPRSLSRGRNVLVTQDARFRDAAQGDYRLMFGSPAVGGGRPVPGGLHGDFLGRAYSHPPSIGAHSRP